MKALVIGLGSMGKRRIDLLQKYFSHITVHGIDLDEERAKDCKEKFGIIVYSGLQEAIRENVYDYAFVCTSPLSHAVIIEDCLTNKINTFTEINLTSAGYKKNIELSKRNGIKLFLSSSMIYREEMQYLYECIKNSKEKLCYNYHVGQYLPDWHPWEDYRKFFAGDKRTNGCREILAIELPWIIRCFGKIVDFKVSKKKISSLDISFDDCYMILFEHLSGTIGTFMADVVSREPVRDLKIIGEQLLIKWNGEPDSFYSKNLKSNSMEQIMLYKNVEHRNGYNKTIIENEYVNEMKQFFGEIANERKMIYGFENDLETLRIIDEIER